jgi:deazaflavin-dependent oxidoreductase (nitroreductase family)
MPELDPSDIKSFNDQLIAEFRENDGKVTGDFQGAPLLLLTTTGAKSGKERVAPLAYGRDGDQIVVIASKAGAPTHPDWYHNLLANPTVKVELPGETFEARAEVASPEARDRLYAARVRIMPGFAEYQEKTDRVIPVVLLTRTAASGAPRP